MTIPERYQRSTAQARIINLTVKYLTDRSHNVDPAVLREFLPYSLAVIEQTIGYNDDALPPRNQWLRVIVPVLGTAYRLNLNDLRIRFSKAFDRALMAIPWLDDNDLWMTSVDRVLRRVAKRAINDPVLNIDKFFFRVAFNLFRSMLKKKQREREAAMEMKRRLTLRERDEDPLRESDFTRDDILRELISFSADKLRQQLRSRRTRTMAAQRVRGFGAAVKLMIENQDRSWEECRIAAQKLAAAQNKRASATTILVPPRATFYAWLKELVGRVHGTHGAA
jgi:hypothetical protein